MTAGSACIKTPRGNSPSPDGVPFKEIGCYFNGAQPGKQASLLIYYRGWLNNDYSGGGLRGRKITGGGNILRSARGALNFYGLKRLALKKGLVVLITGSCDILVKREDIENLQSELGYVFPHIYVAAHSAGYAGLRDSIDSLERIDGIILLDSFYSDFVAKIRRRIQNGTACGGFYTPDSKVAYYQKWGFSGLSCPEGASHVNCCAFDESTSDNDHELWVEKILDKNLP
jgi:hypothetical protein